MYFVQILLWAQPNRHVSVALYKHIATIHTIAQCRSICIVASVVILFIWKKKSQIEVHKKQKYFLQKPLNLTDFFFAQHRNY